MRNCIRTAIFWSLASVTASSNLGAAPPDAEAVKAVLAKLEILGGSADDDGNGGYRVWLSIVKPADIDAAMTLAAGLPDVTELHIGSRATDARLADIPIKFPALLKLDISFSDGITSEGVKSVGKLTKLTHLSVTGMKNLTPADLAPLSGLAELRSFHAYSFPLGGADLFEAWPKLTDLNAKESGLTDADMLGLARLTELKHLNLGGNRYITAAGFACLKPLVKLVTLDLDETLFDDTAAACLAGMSELYALNLCRTRLCGSGLKHLAGHTKLVMLHFDDLPNFTGEGLEHLAGCQELRVLDLSRIAATDAGLVKVAALKQVTNLLLPDYGSGRLEREFWRNFEPNRMTDAGLKAVSTMPLIVELSISGGNVTDAGIAYLARLKEIQTLSLDLLSNVRGPGLAALAELPALNYLSLSETGITDEGLKAVAGLKNLKYLDLPRHSTTDCLPHITGLTRLERLIVPKTWTPVDLEAARKTFPKAEVFQSE